MSDAQTAHRCSSCHFEGHFEVSSLCENLFKLVYGRLVLCSVGLKKGGTVTLLT